MRGFKRAVLASLLTLIAMPVLATDADQLLKQNYPPESLRLGEEGNVGLKLEVNRAGRLRSCAVTKSSGYARLDRASCDVMLLHVVKLSEPGASDRGRGTAFREAAIDWHLPAGTPRPPALPPKSPAVELADAAEPITCRVSTKQGSILVKQKVCLSARDHERAEDYARANRSAL